MLCCFHIIILSTTWKLSCQKLSVAPESARTCWMAGLPANGEKCRLLGAHELKPSSFLWTSPAHWLIPAVPLLFIPADPCRWLSGEVGTGLGLMSPIRRDGIKQSGAMTLDRKEEAKIMEQEKVRRINKIAADLSQNTQWAICQISDKTTVSVKVWTCGQSWADSTGLRVKWAKSSQLI